MIRKIEQIFTRQNRTRYIVAAIFPPRIVVSDNYITTEPLLDCKVASVHGLVDDIAYVILDVDIAKIVFGCLDAECVALERAVVFVKSVVNIVCVAFRGVIRDGIGKRFIGFPRGAARAKQH